MIVPVKTLVTATATAVGGRNGHSETTDKSVSVDLSVPKASLQPLVCIPELVGGPETPVAGVYLNIAGDCSGSILLLLEKESADSLAALMVVDLKIEDASLPQADLEAFVHEAHEKICPYSHATRGNVAVNFTVVGA